jgi:uncharacterized iron-regulated membrane protein
MTETVVSQKTHKLRSQHSRFSRKWWNQQFFLWHRYMGLIAGIFMIIVGLTGAVMVFRTEISHLANYALTHVQPQGEQVSIASMYETIKTNYSDYKIDYLEEMPGGSYDFWLSKDEETTSVFVNPYTGNILGTWNHDDIWLSKVVELHYSLLGGTVGTYVMGVMAVLLFLLCVTGIVLWPGWRKLVNGFKIKWQGHPQRVNFDIHKVAGIVTAIFIGLAAFTGAWWNLDEGLHLTDALYAVTGTPTSWQEDPVSKVVAGQPPLAPMAVYDQMIAEAQAMLPKAKLTSFGLPTDETGTYSVWLKLPFEGNYYGDNIIYFDQYSGKLVRADITGQKPLVRYLLDSFSAVHYGTFWGLPTRILYVLVNLALVVLVITGFALWNFKRVAAQKIKP